MKKSILIYSLEGCPYSQKAEKLLKYNNISHNVIKVYQEKKKDFIEKNKMETFPQIFYVNNGEKILIGGCSELEQILKIKNKIKKNTQKYDKLINSKISDISKNLLIKVLTLFLSNN